MISLSIVVPVYKPLVSDLEKTSLKQCANILGKHNIVFVGPDDMDYSEYTSLIPWAKIERFQKRYFESIKGYNNLMLSVGFYNRFSLCDYILIYQVDAFVFSDQIAEWCLKGFDYIGAPWINEKHYRNLTSGKRSWIWKSAALIKRWLFLKTDWYVGNGGLSLRNINKSLTVLNLYSEFVRKQDINEDLFWSIYAPLLYPFFKVPNRRDAIGFAFEENPEFHFEMNNKILPFGCHAWRKYDPKFWEKYIN